MNAPQPNVAIDTVPVIFDRENGLQVIVAPRQYEPFLGDLALPGVLLLGGESVLAASQRALQVKAGVRDAEFSQTLGVYDDPGRDPRSMTLTIAQLFAVPADSVFAPEAMRVSLIDSPQLPFDHTRIIEASASTVGTLLDKNPEFVKNTLGEVFTTGDMAEALGSVGATFNAANLARTLASKTWLEKAGPAPRAGAGRPATSWRVVS